jgi:hypothetical protein
MFANYSVGPVTAGIQFSEIDNGAESATDEITDAWGIAFNVNDNLSVSYGQRDVEFDSAGTDVTENGTGFAAAYTMGSIKIAGNRNEVDNNGGTQGSTDTMTEIAVSFAF